MSATYSTTDELNEFMHMSEEIPNPSIVGNPRVLEDMGTGATTTTRFYVDNAFIVANSYTFYYGATELAALSQPLTETTHYSLDKDLGVLTLTSAGTSIIGSNNIFSAYKFNNLGFKDSELQDQLDRAQSRIDKKTRNHWADGSVATPDYNQVLNEVHDGRGSFTHRYFSDERPFPDVSTNLNGSTSIGTTSFTVDSTDGFPSSGLLGIGKEKITYSSKATTSFSVTALTIAHSDGDEVLPFVFEASNTIDGAAPTWTILSKGDEYDLSLKAGRVYLSSTQFNVSNAIAFAIQPPFRVPNRFRMSYLWGNNTIPDDINQLILMISAQDLLHRAVRKAHTNGINEFEPSMINVDQDMINDIIKSYKNARMGTQP